MSNSPESKRCTRCRKIKPLDQFWRDKGHRDGRSSWCAACAKATKDAYATETSKERSRKIARAYQKALRRLKKRYPDDFRTLFTAAKKDEGL